MLGTGQGGGKCCGKAIGEVNPSTHGRRGWQSALEQENNLKDTSCSFDFSFETK